MDRAYTPISEQQLPFVGSLPVVAIYRLTIGRRRNNLRSMVTNKHKRPPCRCERLPFPHRWSWHCDAFEDDALDVGSQHLGCADRDEYNADCRERARDCNLTARGY